MYAITDVCVVTSLSKVPENFTPLVRAKDCTDSANVGKKFIAPLFIAFSKQAIKPSLNVLVELSLSDSRESAPAGFTVFDKIMVTEQRSVKKKYLCGRFDSWKPNMAVITELHVAKKSQPGELYICDTASGLVLVAVQAVLQTEPPKPSYSKTRPPAPPAASITEIPRNYSRMALSGVPFELTRNCRDFNDDNILARYALIPKTSYDIENTFSFDFSFEKSIPA